MLKIIKFFTNIFVVNSLQSPNQSNLLFDLPNELSLSQQQLDSKYSWGNMEQNVQQTFKVSIQMIIFFLCISFFLENMWEFKKTRWNKLFKQ